MNPLALIIHLINNTWRYGVYKATINKSNTRAFTLGWINLLLLPYGSLAKHVQNIYIEYSNNLNTIKVIILYERPIVNDKSAPLIRRNYDKSSKNDFS